MDGFFMVVFLSLTMLIGSFISGIIPLTLTLSENKMRHITIIGAGLLIGTALAVIIPEGINTLKSNQGCQTHEHSHVHKRDISIGNNDQIKIAKDRDIAKEQLKIKMKSLDESGGDDDDHDHGKSEESIISHSGIGATLVLGFVFMLFIDQIGGKISHNHHQILDSQAIRNKITFTTTLGLVVHAAADGIALGAAAATSKADVELIVFVAIMLHKAPAAFGLVSFLIHEGLERTRVRKHLIIFSIAAPAMAILTFLLLQTNSFTISSSSSDSTGLCMLFSAGTFLYVSTVHVLPEVQSHNEDRQFKPSEMISFSVGALLPLLLSIGHKH